jgi:hypothetical protein
VIVFGVHLAVQLEELPPYCGASQPFFRQEPLLGQGVELRGSQVSPELTTPSPQLASQSESLPTLEPLGQQPSPPTRIVIVMRSHLALHSFGLPEYLAPLQPSLRQLVALAHGIWLIGSHVSLPVTAPSPQRVSQSLSFPALAPDGQH